MSKKSKKELNGLHEVKGAGYTATKKVKRDKSVNSKAGLHDKLDNSQGEARVKRRKPLAIKHVRRLRKVAVVASLGVVATVSVFGVGFMMSPTGIQPIDDVGNPTVCYEVPTDGSKPTEHTLAENVGYLNYVLKNQPYWSSYAHTGVDAVAMGIPAKQHVNSYKQYYNGVLVVADCSFSGISESLQYGEQLCQYNGVVLSRYSTSTKSDDLNKGMNAPWSEGHATGLTVEAYRSNRGLPPLDFSVYVLNEKTIANAYDTTVVDNGDGTFTMKLELNVNTGNKDTSADYYYRLQMQANGNLNEMPTIYNTELSYTFDASWKILKLEINESYRAKALGMNSDCTAHAETVFDYDEENAKNTFWEDYFKAEYERIKDTVSDDDVVEKEDSCTAMECLAGAFGNVLTDGATFKVDLKLDNLAIDGVVCVDMDNGLGVTAKLGDILVWLDGNALYITDGHAKYKLGTEGLLSAGGDASAQSLTDGLDVNELMSQMTGGEFTYDKNTGVAALATELELFGLKIPVQFEFKKTESGIELNFLKADICLGGKTVNATIRFGDESDRPAIPEDTSDYRDILNDGITFDVALDLNGFKLIGIAKIIMQNGELAGVYANLDDITVYYDLPRNMLYLSKGNLKYKLDTTKLGNGGADFSAMLGTADVNALIKELIASLNTTENTLGTSVDVNIDALGSVLKAAFNIGISGGLKANAELTFESLKISFAATLGNDDITLPELTGYKDILNTEITFDVNLTLLSGEGNVALDGRVALAVSDGQIAEIRADLGGVAIYFDLACNELYLKIGTTKVVIDLDDINSGDLSVLSSFMGGEDISAAVKTLLNNLVVNGKVISTNLTLSALADPVWAELDFNDGLSVRAGLSLLGVDAVANVAISEVAFEGLGEEEKAEYVYILKELQNVVESLIGSHISADVSGTLYSGEEKYAVTDGVKYNFNALLEFDRGEVVGGAVNDAYIHMYIALDAKHPDDDSLYLDMYVLDANPVTGANGRTTGGYTRDGKYDVYLSVSKYEGSSTPLLIYAPSDEILALVSMIGATVHLDEIKVENSKELTEAIGAISDMLNGMLIDKYLPESVKGKFASLGDSLIPQILGVSLQDLLNELFGNIGDAVQDIEGTKFSLSDKYVKGITTTDDSLVIVLDSALIYNNAGITDNLTVTIERVMRDGVWYVGGVSLDNIFFGENQTNKLDIGLKLGYDEVARPSEETAFGGYLNADGIDTLLNGIVNSATHEVEGSEGKYDINHYYLLSGSVKVQLNLFNIGATIQIKSVAVHIDENNNVSVDAHIYYDGVSEVNQTAIDGDADVYISVKGDRIIVKRVKYTHYVKSGLITREVAYDTPLVEVRAMTLKEFSANMMDNVTFIFNFGPVITDNIENVGSGNGGVSFDGKDYGECLDTVISSYVFEETETGASWTFTLNGGLIQAFTGMTCTDIPIRFNADLNADGSYTVKSLEILESTMNLFGNIVKLKLSGNLIYCNPNEQLNGFVDTSKNLFAVNATVNSEFGLGENGIADEIYVECGSRIKLPLSVVADANGQLYMLDGYCVNGGNTYCAFESTAVENGVLYGFITVTDDTTFTAVWNKIYTVSFLGADGEELYSIYCHENEVLGADNIPAVPEVYGYRGEWSGAAGAVVNGNLSFTVKYSPVPYTVTFIDGESRTVFERLYGETISVGELETNAYLADYIYDADGNRYSEIIITDNATYFVHKTGKTFTVVYESDIAFDSSLLDTKMQFGDGTDSLIAAYNADYTFLGWFIESGESYKYVVDADALKDYLAQSCFVDGSTVTLNAVWECDYSVKVTYAKRSYKFLYSEWTIKGSFELSYASEMSKTILNNSDVSVVTYAKYGQGNDAGIKDVLQDYKSFGGNELSLTHTCGQLHDYGWISVKVNYEIGGSAIKTSEKSDCLKKS